MEVWDQLCGALISRISKLWVDEEAEDGKHDWGGEFGKDNDGGAESMIHGWKFGKIWES